VPIRGHPLLKGHAMNTTIESIATLVK